MHCHKYNINAAIGFVFNLSDNSFDEISQASSWFPKSVSTEEQVILVKADVRSLFRNPALLSIDTASRSSWMFRMVECFWMFTTPSGIDDSLNCSLQYSKIKLYFSLYFLIDVRKWILQTVLEMKKMFWVKHFLQVKSIAWAKDSTVVIVLHMNGAWSMLFV